MFCKFVKLFGQVFGPTIWIPEYYSGCKKNQLPNKEYYLVLTKFKYRIWILLFGPTIRIVFEYQIIRHTLTHKVRMIWNYLFHLVTTGYYTMICTYKVWKTEATFYWNILLVATGHYIEICTGNNIFVNTDYYTGICTLKVRKTKATFNETYIWLLSDIVKWWLGCTFNDS